MEQAVGEVDDEPPAAEAEEPTAEAEEATTEAEEATTEAAEATTEAAEAEVPPPEEMARHLLAAWTKPQSGYAFLQEQMAHSSFRKMVIARVVKKLR